MARRDPVSTEATESLMAPDLEGAGDGEGGGADEGAGDNDGAGSRAADGEGTAGASGQGGRRPGATGRQQPGKRAGGRPARREAFESSARSATQQLEDRLTRSFETKTNALIEGFQRQIAQISGQGGGGQGGGGQGGQGGGQQGGRYDTAVERINAAINAETSAILNRPNGSPAYDYTNLNKLNSDLGELRMLQTLEKMGLTPEAIQRLTRGQQQPQRQASADDTRAQVQYHQFVQEFPWVEEEPGAVDLIVARRNRMIAMGEPKGYRTTQAAAQYVAQELGIADMGFVPPGDPSPFVAVRGGGRGSGGGGRRGGGGGGSRTLALPAGALRGLSPNERKLASTYVFGADSDDGQG